MFPLSWEIPPRGVYVTSIFQVAARVDSKGRLLLPKAIRETLGLKGGRCCISVF
ncbi:MAG: AbrB/MazE/SpoVT family DNA-binding domain-containing protein [Firmicutes bacterium]|nr:AbrB/MazE/SpoVT family DNA-binding domain-containing protein [Bacillota bacterium]